MRHHDISPHWPTLDGLKEAAALVLAILAVGMLLWAVTL